MNIIKLLTNDFILFALNITIIGVVYISFISQNIFISWWLEVFYLAISYYIISFITSVLLIIFLFFKVKYIFDQIQYFSAFHKLKIIAYVLDKDFEHIKNFYDFKLNLKIYLTLIGDKRLYD